MADLMIKGLIPNAADTMTVSNGKETGKSEDAIPVFASLMNRNDGSQTGQGGLTDFAISQIKTTDNTITPDALRDKVVRGQQDDTDRGLSPENVDKLQEYNDKIKEAVMEEYDITEEELEEAMETLGLDYIQLLLPENLVKLSVEITGAADSLELLSDPGFKDLFGMMQDLRLEISTEMGLSITPETVDAFAELLTPETADTTAQIDITETLPDTGFSNTENNEEISAESLKPRDVYADINDVSEEAVDTEVSKPVAANEAIAANEATETNEANEGLADRIEDIVTKGIEDGKVEVKITDTETKEASEPDRKSRRSRPIR